MVSLHPVTVIPAPAGMPVSARLRASESLAPAGAGALGARFRGHDTYWFGFEGR